MLDKALVLWMPAPASFTGEDCVEFQTHGGVAVVEGVCDALADAGARMAQPGEFTRRAFEGGRLDLTQAEAVADLVDAETQAQRRQASAQLSGALSDRYRAWYDLLLDASALIEAAIDFPDDDVPGGVAAGAVPLLQSLQTDLRRTLSDARGERVRSGLKVAIVGPTNVGKSSILNALARRDAAIVTPIPGTTRDIVEVRIHIRGQVVVLADTAGLRETSDPVEIEGVVRGRRWAQEADLRIVVVDASRPDTLTETLALSNESDILVVNKDDIAAVTLNPPPQALRISVRTNYMEALETRLADRVRELTGGRGFPGVTRARHRELLTDCLGHVTQALTEWDRGAELIGEDVRLARRCLERLTGLGNPDAVLDRVFSKFCIGK